MNSTPDFRSIHTALDLHLSDDQIDDHLIGDLAAEPAAHLADCAHCIQRVATAAAPIASFESVTMAWSERRSATLPLPNLSAQRPLWQRHMSTAMAGFTFVFGFALINANHEFSFRTADVPPAVHSAREISTPRVIFPTPVFSQTASVHIPPPEAQIAADNQMLNAVDNELEASADTPADSPSALGLETVDTAAPRPLATVSVQD
jgi:hypothetical protein